MINKGVNIMIEFLVNYWEFVVIGVLVLDKIVAITPNKFDDLIWSSIRGILFKLAGKKK